MLDSWMLERRAMLEFLLLVLYFIIIKHICHNYVLMFQVSRMDGIMDAWDITIKSDCPVLSTKVNEFYSSKLF